jgi:hypothetical protein
MSFHLRFSLRTANLTFTKSYVKRRFKVPSCGIGCKKFSKYNQYKCRANPFIPPKPLLLRQFGDILKPQWDKKAHFIGRF